MRDGTAVVRLSSSAALTTVLPLAQAPGRSEPDLSLARSKPSAGSVTTTQRPPAGTTAGRPPGPRAGKPEVSEPNYTLPKPALQTWLVGHGPLEPEPECWLHPDIQIGPSPIAGLGLFARAAIAPGTIVSRAGGRLVTGTELQQALMEAAQRPDHPYVDAITVSENLHLLLPPGQPNHYGNHSCYPNLWWADAYTLAARRPVMAGEELTNDYATSTGVPGFTMTCSGSSLCRGVITGEDWRLPELQTRYGHHWIPALLARIRPA